MNTHTLSKHRADYVHVPVPSAKRNSICLWSSEWPVLPLGMWECSMMSVTSGSVTHSPLPLSSPSCPDLAVTCLDPGLSNCTTQIVMVNINGDDLENTNPTQQLGKLGVTLLECYESRTCFFIVKLTCIVHVFPELVLISLLSSLFYSFPGDGGKYYFLYHILLFHY